MYKFFETILNSTLTPNVTYPSVPLFLFLPPALGPSYRVSHKRRQITKLLKLDIFHYFTFLHH